jgi:hypothetical protein
MDEPIQQSRPAIERGVYDAVAKFGVLVFMFALVYLTQSPQATAPAASFENLNDKKRTANAVASANAFLEALDAKLRTKVMLDFDSAKKSNWSNLPVSMVQRNGVALGDLTKEQRVKAMSAVAAVLSKDGFQKVVDIMDGDQKLAENNGKAGGKGKAPGKGPMFGTDQYYLAIFGTPSETKPWMVQFGGHHLGVNVTVIGEQVVLAPTHTGAQPARFQRGDAEVRPLGREYDTALELINSLDEKQRAEAIIGQRPQAELLLGPGRDGKTIEPKGIKGSALTAQQRGLLLEVIGAWVNTVEPDAAAAWMAEIKAKIGDTHFAWSGPVEKGKAAYFRVQGPAVIIEYAPQGGIDHIHTVIRNPQDDYGAGLIKR